MRNQHVTLSVLRPGPAMMVNTCGGDVGVTQPPLFLARMEKHPVESRKFSAELIFNVLMPP